MQPAAVQLVDRRLKKVYGVTEFTGEIVRDGPSAQGGDAAGERFVGQTPFGLLEVLLGGAEIPGLHSALAEPEQRGGLLREEPEPRGLLPQLPVLLGRGLGLAGGEGALGVGEPEPDVRGQMGRAPGHDLLVRHPEPLGDVPQRLVGGPHASGLQGGDVGGCVGGLRQLPLCQPLLDTQPLHPAPDDLRVVALHHRQLPCAHLPLRSVKLYVKPRIKRA